MYSTIQDVYDAAGIDEEAIAKAVVEKAILAAEKDVDRLTYTTYWSVTDYGTASSGAGSTISDTSKTWTINAFANQWVWIYGGTGSGQMRLISSNTETAITVSRAWDTNPDNTSTYRVIYCASDPEYNDALDGNDEATMFLNDYPIRILESLTINSSAITISDVYVYTNTGKLTLKRTAARSAFDTTYPQDVVIRYWKGVYPIPKDVERYVTVTAAMRALTAQVGGTYDDPSTISLPEGSVTVGQAYINIKSAVDLLRSEAEEIKSRLVVYAAVC